jgi:hypothetical protein
VGWPAPAWIAHHNSYMVGGQRLRLHIGEPPTIIGYWPVSGAAMGRSV